MRPLRPLILLLLAAGPNLARAAPASYDDESVVPEAPGKLGDEDVPTQEIQRLIEERRGAIDEIYKRDLSPLARASDRSIRRFFEELSPASFPFDDYRSSLALFGWDTLSGDVAIPKILTLLRFMARARELQLPVSAPSLDVLGLPQREDVAHVLRRYARAFQLDEHQIHFAAPDATLAGFRRSTAQSAELGRQILKTKQGAQALWNLTDEAIVELFVKEGHVGAHGHFTAFRSSEFTGDWSKAPPADKYAALELVRRAVRLGAMRENGGLVHSLFHVQRWGLPADSPLSPRIAEALRDLAEAVNWDPSQIPFGRHPLSEYVPQPPPERLSPERDAVLQDLNANRLRIDAQRAHPVNYAPHLAEVLAKGNLTLEANGYGGPGAKEHFFPLGRTWEFPVPYPSLVSSIELLDEGGTVPVWAGVDEQDNWKRLVITLRRPTALERTNSANALEESVHRLNEYFDEMGIPEGGEVRLNVRGATYGGRKLDAIELLRILPHEALDLTVKKTGRRPLAPTPVATSAAPEAAAMERSDAASRRLAALTPEMIGVVAFGGAVVGGGSHDGFRVHPGELQDFHFHPSSIPAGQGAWVVRIGGRTFAFQHLTHDGRLVQPSKRFYLSDAERAQISEDEQERMKRIDRLREILPNAEPIEGLHAETGERHTVDSVRLVDWKALDDREHWHFTTPEGTVVLRETSMAGAIDEWYRRSSQSRGAAAGFLGKRRPNARR